jgi:hypothetical protein
MVPMRRRSLLPALLLAAGVTFVPAAAHANTCSTVSIWGTAVPDRTVYPCISPTGKTDLCHSDEAGVDPDANVLVEVCVPLPF